VDREALELRRHLPELAAHAAGGTIEQAAKADFAQRRRDALSGAQKREFGWHALQGIGRVPRRDVLSTSALSTAAHGIHCGE
jgi:hypothetical protein